MNKAQLKALESLDTETIVWGIIVPNLRRKFGFKEIHSVEFICDKVNDVFKLNGEGIEKKTGLKCSIPSKELKLSENSEYLTIAETRIKSGEDFKKANCKQIDVVILKIDNIKKKCTTDIYFINNAGKTDAITLPF